jgi:CubicO group peptidase (beta-lactamase class C family)
VLTEGLAADAYGGAVALVVQRDAIVVELVVGDAQRGPDRRPMAADTIFDLASLTKMVAGLSATLLLLDRGAWSLEDAVARFIPAFARQGKGAITIHHLLTHTSGLPAWAPLYLQARTADEVLPVLCELELESAPGSQVVYSDLGFVLLGLLVERCAGEPFQQLLARELFAPLGMQDTGYLPAPALRARCAATSYGNDHEAAMLARNEQAFPGWRTHLLVGEAQDGNAHYALEGVSAHAGLFATAHDLSRFARMYLAEGAFGGRQVISAAAIRAATRPHTAHLNMRYGLGWRVADHALARPPAPRVSEATSRYFPPDPDATLPPVPFMGDLVSERAYGHTGFTGTSLVIDPAHELAIILLTNAVHTDPERAGITLVRPRFHNAVCAATAGAPP